MHDRAKPAVVRTKGEQYVWMSSMGLTIGLLMVGCLLWLIVSQGIAVFWPTEVARITLKSGVSAPGHCCITPWAIIRFP